MLYNAKVVMDISCETISIRSASSKQERKRFSYAISSSIFKPHFFLFIYILKASFEPIFGLDLFRNQDLSQCVIEARRKLVKSHISWKFFRLSSPGKLNSHQFPEISSHARTQPCTNVCTFSHIMNLNLVDIMLRQVCSV